MSSYFLYSLNIVDLYLSMELNALRKTDIVGFVDSVHYVRYKVLMQLLFTYIFILQLFACDVLGLLLLVSDPDVR